MKFLHNFFVKITLCTIFFIISLNISFAYPRVPFEGMEINTQTETKTVCGNSETADTFEELYIYEEAMNKNRFLVHSVDRDDKLEYDANSREILRGESRGQKTTHWISPDVSVGDKIKIRDNYFIVRSTTDIIETDDWKDIETIRLSRRTDEEKHLSNSSDILITYEKEKFWYDSYSGILLRNDIEREIYHEKNVRYCDTFITRELKATGTDNSGDGVSDLDNVFLERKDPLAKTFFEQFLSFISSLFT